MPLNGIGSSNNYEIHGLSLASEVPLPLPNRPRSRPNIEVFWGARASIPDQPADGEVVQQFLVGNGGGYSCVRTAAGYTMRFHGCCEFRIARDLSTIRVHLAPDTDPRWAALFLSGNVLAMILMLSGKCVLHASAVEMGSGAFAFVAASGMGKSTLATLFCLRGFRLVTDDVLRMDFRPEGVFCFPGAAATRLRPNAAMIAEGFRAELEGTVDGRISVRLGHLFPSLPCLKAIIIPKLSHVANQVRVKKLEPKEALLCISRYPRIQGVQDKELRRSQFGAMVQVVETLSVYEAEIPWGPPLDGELPRKVLEGLNRAQGVRARRQSA